MGKTAAGAVWLNEAQLPAWDFWQYWRNADDRDVGRFLRLFTDLPLDEVVRLEALQGSEINAAKVVLANEVTKLCRGEHAARAAEATAAATFAGGGVGEDLPEWTIPAEGMHHRRCAGRDRFRRQPGRGQAPDRGRRRADRWRGRFRTKRIGLSPAGADLRISSGKKKHGVLRPA